MTLHVCPAFCQLQGALTLRTAFFPGSWWETDWIGLLEPFLPIIFGLMVSMTLDFMPKIPKATMLTADYIGSMAMVKTAEKLLTSTEMEVCHDQCSANLFNYSPN